MDILYKPLSDRKWVWSRLEVRSSENLAKIDPRFTLQTENTFTKLNCNRSHLTCINTC